MRYFVEQGDCVEKMGEMPEAFVDAIVCDPPYGLKFMGEAFDTFAGEGVDPAFCHWFAGFTDGEGCFSVHKKLVSGYETYDCQFIISLRADDRPVLERIRRELGIGTLADRPGSDEKNPQARFCVSSQRDCLVLRDVFRAFPLRAKKATDFEIWSQALQAWIEHEPLQWGNMAEARDRLMANRQFKAEGIRVDPFQMWTFRWARAAFRVLKPGGYLLAFGGTRTEHRMTCAIEDAGFEIRDKLAWMHGQGFPKSARVNRDPRFCQCASVARSGESTAPELTLADHNDTGPDVFGGGLPREGVPRSTGKSSGSMGDCRKVCGFDDARAPRYGAGAPISSPSQECVQGRTHRLRPVGDV